MSGGRDTDEATAVHHGPPKADVPAPVLDFTLEAEPATVGAVRSAVRRFAAAHGADGDVIGSIALGVSEAVTNAVLHAFIGRPPGSVRTVVSAGPGELTVRIIDDGRGMQPRPDSPGMGVGLPTMAQLTSALDIRRRPEGGTEVCMTFVAPGVRGGAEVSAPTATDRARVLQDVARLSAGVGWPGEGVEALVGLLCPAIVEVCAVDILEDDGTPRRLAACVAHQPRLARWLGARAPQSPYPDSPTYGALSQGTPYVAAFDAQLLEAAAVDPDDLANLRALPARWWVSIPLGEATDVRGLLHVGLARSRPPDPEEVAFFEQVARQATQGLANTRLIDELRRTRRRLQRILSALSEAVTVHDAHRQMVYANPAAARLLHAADIPELLAAETGTLAARFHVTREDGTPVTVADFPGQRLLSGQEGTPLLTHWVHRDSGRERWLLTKSSLLDDDGLFAVSIIEDVTDSRRAERQQRFLARSGRLLIGPPPDMLQQLADMAVQDLADWCIIDLLDERGALHRAAIAHRDDDRRAIAVEADRRWPPERRPQGPIGELLCGGPAIIVPRLTDEMLARWARDAEHLQLLREMGMRSVIVAPIRTGELTRGALHLISAESARSFEEGDRAFASDLGERLALALQASAEAG